jgi:succinyl-CoA synthetase beta subunit
VLLPESAAKTLFAEYGIVVPDGRVVDTAAEATAAAADLGLPVVLKVQTRGGGRGLADGEDHCADLAAVGAAHARLAARWPEARGPRGVLVEQAIAGAAGAPAVERYLAVAVDPRLGQAVLMTAAVGGVDLGARAGSISRQPIAPSLGLQPYHAVGLLAAAGWPRERLVAGADVALCLYRLFREQEAIVAEINPLAETADRTLVALDARVALDESAFYRLPRWRDLVLGDEARYPQEALKLRYGFDYVDLDAEGTVGLISTGAGGTMLLADLIRARGGRPANFVDLRTGGMRGDPTRLEVVLGRLCASPHLRAALVSVFGGITDIGQFAETLLQAIERVGGVPWPLVVRLEGYGAERGLALLAAAGIAAGRDLAEALDRVVALAAT